MTPSGTTAHRPTLPDEGDIRYNTTLATYEGYSGSAWLDLSATVVSTWLDLTDTDPASFGDAAGQAVQVNEAGTGLEFAGAVSIPVAPIEFSANGSFSYTHNRGEQPVVSVTDSSGHEIEVCVQHPTVNTVSLSFIGTLTDAVLIFN